MAPLKTIHYADFDIITTDETLDAVLAYAQALALKERSDTVHILAVDSDGTTREFDLLIGPASELLVSGVDLVHHLNDAAVVSDLTAKTRGLEQENQVVPDGTIHDYVELDTDSKDFL
jgi:hypothetical protein